MAWRAEDLGLHGGEDNLRPVRLFAHSVLLFLITSFFCFYAIPPLTVLIGRIMLATVRKFTKVIGDNSDCSTCFYLLWLMEDIEHTTLIGQLGFVSARQQPHDNDSSPLTKNKVSVRHKTTTLTDRLLFGHFCQCKRFESNSAGWATFVNLFRSVEDSYHTIPIGQLL